MSRDKKFLTPADAANYLSISKSHLLFLFRKGKIVGYKLGHRTVRFTREGLDTYTNSKEKII